MKTLPQYINRYFYKEKKFRLSKLKQSEYGIDYVPTTDEVKCNLYVTPGWMDIHTHIAEGIGWLSIDPEKIGRRTGVFVLGDAGSTGALTFLAFKKYIMPVKKEMIRAWIHINVNGLVVMPETLNKDLISIDKTISCIKENSDQIIGIKVRLLPDEDNPHGLLLVEKAKRAAVLAGKALMLHVSSGSSYVPDALDMLDRGDIVTHIMHPFPNSLWTSTGAPTEKLKSAIKRGVILDIGNGRLSFDFDICEKVLTSNKSLRFCISSDIHKNSFPSTPNLATTLNRMYACGYGLEKIIQGITSETECVLNMQNWSSAEVGKHSTIFELIESDEGLVLFDAKGERRILHNYIRPVAIIENDTVQFLDSDLATCTS